jgi:three-Cys-motif partner protein
MTKQKKDRWDDLCRLVEADDGLPTRDVGNWTEEKFWFWSRYIDITTSAMVGHPAWPGGLVYVDLFAGPGICTARDSGERMPGSVLIAANAPKALRQIIACELEPKLASACELRLARTPAAGRCQVIVGDCNERIDEIAAAIPDGVLTLAFIDPPGLHAHFETLRKLSARGRVDLLILFADAVDALRNVAKFEHDDGSRLDLVLGSGSKWRERRKDLNQCTADTFRKLLSKIYCEQLRQLDYREFDAKVIRSHNGPLYRLVFASKHPLGLEFWKKITKRDKGGQRDLFS